MKSFLLLSLATTGLAVHVNRKCFVITADNMNVMLAEGMFGTIPGFDDGVSTPIDSRRGCQSKKCSVDVVHENSLVRVGLPLFYNREIANEAKCTGYDIAINDSVCVSRKTKRIVGKENPDDKNLRSGANYALSCSDISKANCHTYTTCQWLHGKCQRVRVTEGEELTGIHTVSEEKCVNKGNIWAQVEIPPTFRNVHSSKVRCPKYKNPVDICSMYLRENSQFLTNSESYKVPEINVAQYAYGMAPDDASYNDVICCTTSNFQKNSLSENYAGEPIPAPVRIPSFFKEKICETHLFQPILQNVMPRRLRATQGRLLDSAYQSYIAEHKPGDFGLTNAEMQCEPPVCIYENFTPIVLNEEEYIEHTFWRTPEEYCRKILSEHLNGLCVSKATRKRDGLAIKIRHKTIPTEQECKDAESNRLKNDRIQCIHRTEKTIRSPSVDNSECERSSEYILVDNIGPMEWKTSAGVDGYGLPFDIEYESEFVQRRLDGDGVNAKLLMKRCKMSPLQVNDNNNCDFSLRRENKRGYECCKPDVDDDYDDPCTLERKQYCTEELQRQECQPGSSVCGERLGGACNITKCNDEHRLSCVSSETTNACGACASGFKEKDGGCVDICDADTKQTCASENRAPCSSGSTKCGSCTIEYKPDGDGNCVHKCEFKYPGKTSKKEQCDAENKTECSVVVLDPKNVTVPEFLGRARCDECKDGFSKREKLFGNFECFVACKKDEKVVNNKCVDCDAGKIRDAGDDPMGKNTLCATDTDNDDRQDSKDNCPDVSNADQADADDDGVGDVCDNCPDVSNPDQIDTEDDGVGDICDSDPDGLIS